MIEIIGWIATAGTLLSFAVRDMGKVIGVLSNLMDKILKR
jgi:hypothetical protein